MLIFKSITWKNFLSTGNVENTVNLNDRHSTLVIGKNGHGKSTMIEAITFALFGKAFRSITKNQLINSVNKKNCLVTLTFSVNGSEYKVSRGIKPNVFEIYCDGVLLNQDAALKDYQAVLEQQILKLNYKTFTQVVILGSSSFVPFMQLPAGQRREVIEDILDIKVFSTMNGLLKEKISSTKEALKNVENKLESTKTKIDSQKALLNVMLTAKEDTLGNLKTNIEENNKKIEEFQQKSINIQQKIEELKQKQDNKTEVQENIDKAKGIKYKLNSSIETNQANKKFFESNDTCPTCSQSIQQEHKKSFITNSETAIKENEEKIAYLNQALEKLNATMSGIVEISNQITDLNIELSTNNNSIKMLNEQNTNYNNEITKSNSNNDNIDLEKQKLKEYAKEAVEFVNEKTSLMEQRTLQDISSLLLKDTGIKTAIIREYLPLMNKLINQYLAAMDLFVKFELDEGFNESIKSRHRDDFTYTSFSEGEKQKVDISLLFAWRKIAEMKNSVNTNLLIMDEIFDSSLDGASTDALMDVLNDMNKQTNIFIISHKSTDAMREKFEQTIEFQKKNDFSVIV